MNTKCIQNVIPNGYKVSDKMDTQVRLGKDRLSKDNKYMSDSNEYRLALYLFKYIKLNNEKAKEPNFESWAKQFDYILRLDERNVTIETGLNMGIEYGKEMVQTSPTGTDYAEQEMIKAIDKLERELLYKKKKILKLHTRIREMEEQSQGMQFNLSMLNEESKRFIEWKYGECKSVEWIANEIYAGARATAYRKREELVEDVAQWCNFTK